MAQEDRPRDRRRRSWWIAGLAIAALVVVVLVPLASADPDGLVRVAQDQGFLGAAREAVFSVFDGYAIPGIEGDASRIVAGLIGVAIVFGLMLVLGRMLAKRRG
jgi:cobalt/nickel transport system permease protein